MGISIGSVTARFRAMHIAAAFVAIALFGCNAAVAGVNGTLTLSSANYSVAASDGSLTVTVNRSAGSTGAISVQFVTLSTGTAVHGLDYASIQGTLNWADGDTSAKTYSVRIFNSNKTSTPRTFSVDIHNPQGGAVLGTPSVAVVSITGVAPAVSYVSLSASAYTVAASAGSVTITALRTGSSSGAISVQFVTLSTGTAVHGVDYASIQGTLNWADGDSSPKTYSVQIFNSNQTVTPRTFSVDVHNPMGGAVLGTPSTAVVSITGTTTGGTMSAQAAVAVTDLPGVYTYHSNSARDGTNTQEYALTKSNVNSARFGKLASCVVDGAIYAQPLRVANVTVNGAKHNVAYVATQHDGLFAFDADASPCVKLWSVNLIDGNHGGAVGETSVPGSLVGVGAGDIQPEVGVTGTPVIDPARGILYVVSKSIDSAQTNYFTRIHAIDLATGSEKSGSPALITGSYPGTGSGGTSVAFDSHQELQRAGLALVNGLVYVAFTAHEDKAPWYGWMMSYQYDGTALTQKAVINVAPNKKRGGIWMSGGAPAVDPGNKLYVVTGNGDFDAADTTAPNNDYGDTLLQLTPSLTVSQWFTPSDADANAASDGDFGSGGAAVLADLPAGNVVTHAAHRRRQG